MGQFKYELKTMNQRIPVEAVQFNAQEKPKNPKWYARLFGPDGIHKQGDVWLYQVRGFLQEGEWFVKFRSDDIQLVSDEFFKANYVKIDE